MLALALSAAVVFSDYRTQEPGLRQRLTLADLPAPGATPSAVNGPSLVRRPKGALPKVPAGYEVSLYAEGLDEPRQLRLSPDGVLFVAESGAGRVVTLEGGKPRVFASGLNRPFGLAFKDGWVYVANTDSVVRFKRAGGEPETVVPRLKTGARVGGGGHWTRDLAFSKDGKTLYVSVGSRSNVDEDGEEWRANILALDASGGPLRVHASGLRNPVGLAVDPGTGELWTSVNERDGLGDDLPPDYVTRVAAGGFYGWPWYYMGGRQDPRHAGKRPELKAKVLTPDVLIQPHSAPLGLGFWDGRLYVALHGSWNRAVRTGYAVARLLPDGAYEYFLTGFVTADGDVWGRPVGVAAGGDGALYVSDDAGGRIWRVAKARK